MTPRNSRRKFMHGLLGGVFIPPLISSSNSLRAQPRAMDDKPAGAKVLLQPFDYTGVRLLDGMLREQYLATRDYYYKIPDDDILKGFRQRAGLCAPGQDMGGWCRYDCESMFGQWLSGMARMYKATGDVAMRDKAAHLMQEWGKTIEPNRNSFYMSEPQHGHYIWDKIVCGLVDLGGYGGQQEAIPLLDRITQWAMATLDRSRAPATSQDIAAGPSGAEWYTLSENLYRAYQLTGDSKYKDFGDVWRYSHYWGMFTGKVPVDTQGLHAYSHVNTLSSAAMTYFVTGDPEYLKTIVNAYDYFQRTQCFASGGFGPAEQLQAPDGSLGKSLAVEPTLVWPTLPGRTFETPCGSWAVFKLGRYLMMFTGKAHYGDWIEKLVYNGIGAALPMSGRGETFYYADYRVGGGTKRYFHDTWPCCSGTYIQDVADYHNLIYFRDSSGLYVNLFVPSEVSWQCRGEDVKVVQETSYPESETTSLTVAVEKTTPFALSFRVPAWSEGVTANLNGSALNVPIKPGAWATIQRDWNPGDRVTVRIPMRLALAPVDPQHPHRAAVTYGPVVLVREQEKEVLPTPQDPSHWITATGHPLEFRGQAQSVGNFVPFYRIGHGTPYCMYFDFAA